jgi:hypothetical protein
MINSQVTLLVQNLPTKTKVDELLSLFHRFYPVSVEIMRKTTTEPNITHYETEAIVRFYSKRLVHNWIGSLCTTARSQFLCCEWEWWPSTMYCNRSYVPCLLALFNSKNISGPLPFWHLSQCSHAFGMKLFVCVQTADMRISNANRSWHFCAMFHVLFFSEKLQSTQSYCGKF